jgi:hypothetical protein
VKAQKAGQLVRSSRQHQYIVHLDIHAAAADRADAVLRALDLMRFGKPNVFSYSVDEVATGAATAAVPAQSSAEALHGTWGDRCYPVDNRFHGEFLG